MAPVTMPWESSSVMVPAASRGVACRARRRSPIRLLSASTVKFTDANESKAPGANRSGCGPGTTRSTTAVPARVAPSVLRVDVVAERRADHASSQVVTGGDRAGAETREEIGGATPEEAGPDESPGDRQVATEAIPDQSHVEYLARCHRHHLVHRHRLALQPELGSGSDHRHERRAEATQGRSLGGGLERHGVGRIAHQPIGQLERGGIGRAGGRHPDGGHAAPAAILSHRAQSGLGHHEHRVHRSFGGPEVGGGRRRGGRLGEFGDLGPGLEAHVVARSQAGIRGQPGVEERLGGPADQLPAARRRRRVDRGVAVGQGDRASRHDRSGTSAAGDAGELLGQALEVGEAGREADRGHGEARRRHQIGHPVRPATGHLGHLGQVGTVKDARDGHQGHSVGPFVRPFAATLGRAPTRRRRARPAPPPATGGARRRRSRGRTTP